MKNRTDLITRALRNLGALPQGQSPNVEEQQSLSDLIDAMIADLAAREITLLTIDPDAFDDQYLIPLGLTLAWAAASEFGQDGNQNLLGLAVQAELKLKKMTVAQYTRRIAHGQYY